VNPAALLTQGEGYWLIRKKSFSIAKAVTMTPLGRDGNVGIPLHEGFNIISNPFELDVPLSTVIAKNAGLSNARLYTYTGAGYDTSATFEPFKGYYFFKSAATSNGLKVPYPFSPSSAQRDSPPVDWQVQLEYRTASSVDKLNFVGVSAAAGEGLDSLEHNKPPLMLRHGYLYFARPDWDRVRPLFSDDFRPSLGEGQVWEFDVSSPNKTRGTILFRGIESIPRECRVLLVNRTNTVPVDLRADAEYVFTPTDERTRFMLIVGTQQFVAGETSRFVPERFSLMQNYPNPFNPSTTISYTVSRTTRVRIEIISMLGQRVKVLADEVHALALYSKSWDATADDGAVVASGVYFYRLIADGSIFETKKMLLLR
jgi:hypothetical protein